MACALIVGTLMLVAIVTLPKWWPLFNGRG